MQEVKEMSRNTDSHFGNIPLKNIKRSKFKMPCTYSTTGNTGEIIPFYSAEVLPGDTANIRTSMLIRMTTPIAPVMDNAWADTYYFFIPRRLVWDHWAEFMGENTNDAWTQTTEYTIPQLTTPEGGWVKGTLGEKLYGIQGREGSVDACYARSYVAVFNEWFRNQNVTEPAELSTGDATTNGSNGTDYVVDMQKGGQLAKAVKYADYFTRALPEPQKGPDVFLPLGQMAPVVAINSTDTTKVPNNINIGLTNATYNSPSGNSTYNMYPFDATNETNLYYTGTGSPNTKFELATNLQEAEGATINQLRQAFAVQRLYELDARGGWVKAFASSIKKSRKKTGRLNRKAS